MAEDKNSCVEPAGGPINQVEVEITTSQRRKI